MRWDFGAPLPHLLVNDYKAFLIFLVKTTDPSWDGSYVTIKDPASDQAEPLAFVEFHRCSAARLGTPNDEVFHGHPLEGTGLEGYTPQLVRNSRWIAELERINSVHTGYRREHWADRNHYVLLVPRLDLRVRGQVIQRGTTPLLDGGAARGSLPPTDPVIRSAAHCL